MPLTGCLRPDWWRVNIANAEQDISRHVASLCQTTLTYLPQRRIYASVNWFSIDSGSGPLPLRRQVISWNSTGLLSIGHIGVNRYSVIFSQDNAFEIVVCKYGGHFFQGVMSYGYE